VFRVAAGGEPARINLDLMVEEGRLRERSSLGSLGLDPRTPFHSTRVALEERCGRVEFEVSDGMIDPRWTLLELHHFASAFLDRAASCIQREPVRTRSAVTLAVKLGAVSAM
jgi:hypothetical protein